jgi:hypothetical protein
VLIALSNEEAIVLLNAADPDLITGSGANAIKNATTMHFKSSMPLGLVLSICENYKAGTDEDRIYALLGISTKKNIIVPKSGTNTTEIYKEAAIKLLLSQENAAFILPHAGVGYRRKYRDLPTWVLDWSTPHSSQLLSSYYTHEMEQAALFPSGILDPDYDEKDAARHWADFAYKASGSTIPQIEINVDSETMAIKGIMCDTVSDLSPIRDFSEHAKHIEKLEKIHDWYREALALVERLVSAHYPFPNSHSSRKRQSCEEAFWRTVIGDRTSEARLAPPVYGEYHRLWARSRIIGAVMMRVYQTEAFKALSAAAQEKEMELWVAEFAELIVGEYGRCQGIYRCWNISYVRAENPIDPTAEVTGIRICRGLTSH